MFLIYRIPATPTSKRLYVWRKLKLLGAIALQDATFALPHTEKTLERFQWLAVEITEMDGEASVWVSRAANAQHAENLKQQFCTHVEQKYAEIMAQIESAVALADDDLKELRLKKAVQELLAAKQYDYFGSSMEADIRALLRTEQDKQYGEGGERA